MKHSSWSPVSGARGWAVAHAAFFVSALLAVSGAQAATQRDSFVVLSSGEQIGTLVAVTNGRQVDVDWRIDDNGRGPKIRERVKLDERGVPIDWRIEGKAWIGAPVEESFTYRGGVARYQSLNDSGSMRAAQAPFYLANDGSPWSLEPAARLALAAPNQTIEVAPSGSLTVKKVRDLKVGSGARALTVGAYSATGLGLSPSFFLMDAEQKVFAHISAGWVIVREGYQSEFRALSELAQALDSEALAQYSREQRKQYDVPIFIRNVRVFDAAAGTLGAPTTIAVFRGRITSLAAQAPATGAAVIVDGAGGTVVPGLFDMHGHYGAWQAPLHLGAGVTTVRDMGNDNDSLLALKQRIDAGELLGPRLLLSGFIEGRSPFSSRGGFVVDDAAPALDAVRWYADRGYRQIKIYNSFTPDWVLPVAAEAHRLGLKVSGHIPAFMTSERAVRDGYDEINHINQLVLSFVITETEDTRTPFRFTALGERVGKLDLGSEPVQRMVKLMKERGTTLDPTLAIFQQMLLSQAGKTAPNDANWLDNMPASVQRGRRAPVLDVKPGQRPAYEESWQKLKDVIKLVHDSGIRIVPGTDDMPGFMLHSELESYVAAGIPAARVLQIATLDTARYVGLDQQVGSIERGKQADLLLVDGDPTQDITALRKTRLVMQAGAVLLPPEMHRALGIKPFTTPPSIEERK
jgi:imidazolonepropionase-like amidohydrolase